MISGQCFKSIFFVNQSLIICQITARIKCGFFSVKAYGLIPGIFKPIPLQAAKAKFKFSLT